MKLVLFAVETGVPQTTDVPVVDPMVNVLSLTRVMAVLVIVTVITVPLLHTAELARLRSHDIVTVGVVTVDVWVNRCPPPLFFDIAPVVGLTSKIPIVLPATILPNCAEEPVMVTLSVFLAWAQAGCGSAHAATTAMQIAQIQTFAFAIVTDISVPRRGATPTNVK